jgi:hypothetical protein
MHPRWLAASLLALPLAACGSEEPPGSTGGSVTQDGGAGAGGSGGGAEAEWQPLITGDWALPGGTEGYVCARKTVDEDIIVSAFEAINPLGTHHTLLTVGEPDGEDGVTPCNAGANRPRSLFGSGVGTDPFSMPEGVGMRIPAGSQLLLNLHLFNTGTAELTGESGTRVRVLSESELEHEAEGILAGTTALDIPAGQTTEHTGYCTMAHDVTIFAVAPHMHQLGIYERVVAESAAHGEVVLHDEPYSFDEQSYKLIEPVQLLQGERVRVECTHHNTTDARVTFGDSSLEEMCFAGLYRYPAGDGFFICVDGGAGSVPPIDGPPCAEPGATGNSEGVGKECTRNGGECGGLFCVNDFVEGTWGNFCTKQCAEDADCGAGATCVQRDGSPFSTCIPDACVGTGIPRESP